MIIRNHPKSRGRTCMRTINNRLDKRGYSLKLLYELASQRQTDNQNVALKQEYIFLLLPLR